MPDLEPKLLKSDVFGEVRLERAPRGPVIVRDTAPARPWTRWIARRLLAREARALAALDGVRGVPRLLDVAPDRLVRDYVRGTPLFDAAPPTAAFFRAAARLLRRVHAAGVTHNDLAKEANLLVDDDGEPVLIDFQLAARFGRRSRLFRLLAREDRRHLLKHRRTYCAETLTARQRALLERPSLPSRVWMRTGKPAYLFVTRRLLGWSDRDSPADRST